MQVSNELDSRMLPGAPLKEDSNSPEKLSQGRAFVQGSSLESAIPGLIARYLPLVEAEVGIRELIAQFKPPSDVVAEREAFRGREQERLQRKVAHFLDDNATPLELGKGPYPTHTVLRFSFATFNFGRTAQKIKKLFQGLLKYVPSLQELDLASYHYLLPSGICDLQNFKQLTTLSISIADYFSVLSDEDWQNVGTLTQLTSVRIEDRDKYLPRAALEALAALPNLTSLALHRCRVAGSDFPVLSQMKGLKSLHIQGEITDRLLNAFASLPEIESLTIDTMTTLSEAAASHLAQLKKLKHFKFIGNSAVSYEALPHLATMTQLEELDLGASRVWHEGRERRLLSEDLRYFSPLTKLQQLALRHSEIRGDGVRHLSGLVELRKLDLGYSSIDDEGLQHIANFTKLQELSLEKTNIGNNGLKHLVGLIELRSVNLKNTKLRGNTCLEPLAGCVHMQTLDVTETGVTNQALRSLQRMSELSTLDLEKTNVTSAGVKFLVQFVHLTNLTLSDTKINDRALPHFEKMKQLKELQLYNIRLSDKLLQTVKKMPRLCEIYTYCSEAPLPDEVSDAIRNIMRQRKLDSI